MHTRGVDAGKGGKNLDEFKIKKKDACYVDSGESGMLAPPNALRLFLFLWCCLSTDCHLQA